MRVCVVYDCLYPWTVGGAERWLRALSERLAAEGHDVTYLTRRQWEADDPPVIRGVRVVAVSRREELYGADGGRRIGPPLRFGLGVLLHLVRNRRSYDLVHLCSFPYFPVLATRLALVGTGIPVGVDWFEVWTLRYWQRYLGRARGLVGWVVQRLCVAATRDAHVFSELHERRLQAQGLRRPPLRLGGLYAGPREASVGDAGREALVLFAGRLIPEKRATAVPFAVAAARRRIDGLRGLILGNGPQRELVLRAITESGMAGAVEAPGFVSSEEVDAAMRRATCMLLPSSREGYGLVVIEAAARGTPSVVVAGADNAAVELVEEGVNGYVAASEDPEDIASAIVRVHEGGADLRRRTAAWFQENAATLSLEASVRRLVERYAP